MLTDKQTEAYIRTLRTHDMNPYNMKLTKPMTFTRLCVSISRKMCVCFESVDATHISVSILLTRKKEN